MSQSLEQELNELRTLIAQSASTTPPKTLKVLEQRLSALEEKLTDPKDLVLRALAVANDGKPGYLSNPQLEERCKLTKNAVHHAVNALERKGRVWIRKTHGENGRPVFYVYDPRAVKA
jgi:DNA-binding MarR family transcriptional regulator